MWCMHIITHLNGTCIVKICEAHMFLQWPELVVYPQFLWKVFIGRWGIRGVGLPAFKEHDFPAEGSDSIHSQARVCTGMGLRGSLRLGGCPGWTSFRDKRKTMVGSEGTGTVSTPGSYLSRYLLHDNISGSISISSPKSFLFSYHTFSCTILLTIDRLDSVNIILRKWVFARIQGDVIGEHQSCLIIGVREPQGVAKFMSSHEKQVEPLTKTENMSVWVHEEI